MFDRSKISLELSDKGCCFSLGKIVTVTLDLETQSYTHRFICSFARKSSKNVLNNLNQTMQRLCFIKIFGGNLCLQSRFCKYLFKKTITWDETSKFTPWLLIKDEWKCMLGDPKTKFITKQLQGIQAGISINTPYGCERYLKRRYRKWLIFLPQHAVVVHRI